LALLRASSTEDMSWKPSTIMDVRTAGARRDEPAEGTGKGGAGVRRRAAGWGGRVMAEEVERGG
jgi:hypothetical protein